MKKKKNKTQQYFVFNNTSSDKPNWSYIESLEAQRQYKKIEELVAANSCPFGF